MKLNFFMDMNFPFLELIFCRAFDSDVHALRPHKGQQLVAILAHSCARFPCYLDNQCKDPMDNNKDCAGGEKCPPDEGDA